MGDRVVAVLYISPKKFIYFLKHPEDPDFRAFRLKIPSPPESRLLVLVEKKCEYKLRDMGDTHTHLRWLEEGQNQVINWAQRSQMKFLLAWSPREDWLTRLTPPYNEATNHV
jgi:hypothetical protein